MKSGDVDPRCDVAHCFTVSDKASSIGGGVLEAILNHRFQPHDHMPVAIVLLAAGTAAVLEKTSSSQRWMAASCTAM